jgi:hypothetical protein
LFHNNNNKIVIPFVNKVNQNHRQGDGEEQFLKRDKLVIPNFKQKMMSFRGQDSWAKMTSAGDK